MRTTHNLTALQAGQEQRIGEQKQRAKLITVDKKYSLLNQEHRRQVQSHLETELDYLLGRRELDQMRKRKIKEVEDAFERQRADRISKIDQKITRSDKNRAQNLREKQSQSRRNLELTDQKIRRKADADEKQLERSLEAQQEYLKRSHSRHSSKSHRSTSAFKDSRSNNVQSQLQNSMDTIDSRIQLIESRINHAKTNQQFYHRQKSERARGFYRDVDETLSKIQANQSREETKCIQEYYSRITHIISCQQRSKSFYQKESERRKRNIDDRFQKCNQNLKYLSNQRESKMEKLSAKLDSSSFAPKSWRNHRDEIYLERFMTNQKKIRVEHSLKAEGIISKHFNLSLKNKALRQKKDRIFQTVRREIV